MYSYISICFPHSVPPRCSHPRGNGEETCADFAQKCNDPNDGKHIRNRCCATCAAIDAAATTAAGATVPANAKGAAWFCRADHWDSVQLDWDSMQLWSKWRVGRPITGDTQCADGKFERFVPSTSCTASSTLRFWPRIGANYSSSYACDSAFDEKAGTAWATKGEGVGSWIESDLGGTFSVSRFDYVQRANAREHNKDILLAFSDGSSQNFTLQSTDKVQTFTISPARATTSVKLTVNSVYATTNNGAVAIRFYAVQNFCSEWCNSEGLWGCGRGTMLGGDGRNTDNLDYSCSCAGCNGCASAPKGSSPPAPTSTTPAPTTVKPSSRLFGQRQCPLLGSVDRPSLRFRDRCTVSLHSTLGPATDQQRSWSAEYSAFGPAVHSLDETDLVKGVQMSVCCDRSEQENLSDKDKDERPFSGDSEQLLQGCQSTRCRDLVGNDCCAQPGGNDPQKCQDDKGVAYEAVPGGISRDAQCPDSAIFQCCPKKIDIGGACRIARCSPIAATSCAHSSVLFFSPDCRASPARRSADQQEQGMPYDRERGSVHQKQRRPQRAGLHGFAVPLVLRQGLHVGQQQQVRTGVVAAGAAQLRRQQQERTGHQHLHAAAGRKRREGQSDGGHDVDRSSCALPAVGDGLAGHPFRSRQ